MGKDAAFKVLAKVPPNRWAWRMVVALAVKLARAGEFKPGLKMLADSAIKQGTLGVARVVESGFEFGFGFGTVTGTRMPMRRLGSGATRAGRGGAHGWCQPDFVGMGWGSDENRLRIRTDNLNEERAEYGDEAT